mgnify:CR=1 FL=1
MNIVNLADKSNSPIVSFEFIPPRDETSAEKLEAVIDTLCLLGPDLVSVTFGVGGSTRKDSSQLINKLIHEKGLNVIAYFAGYGLGKHEITSILDGYAEN